MKVNIANQNTGVISTPNAGGIFPLASLNNGSDGHATTAQGKSFRFVSGYQDETTRQSYCVRACVRSNMCVIVFVLIKKRVSSNSR